MIDFTQHNHRFTYRTAGVAIQDGHILLHTMDDANYWILPGGRVEIGETSAEALAREMREELGQDVHVERLLWIVESFLTLDDQRVHGIGLYYRMSFPAGSRLATQRDAFEVMDGGVRLSFAWHPLSRLSELTVYPPFLQQRLHALPDHPTHIKDMRP